MPPLRTFLAWPLWLHSLCFPSTSLVPSTQYPLLDPPLLPDTWCCIVLGLHPWSSCLLCISPLVISYCLRAFNSIYILMTQKYTSLAQMLFPISDPYPTAYLTCPYVNFTYPAGCLRRTWSSSVSNLLYLKLSPSHFMTLPFFLLLRPKPLSSSLLSWFLLKPKFSAFWICQNLTTYHLHCYHPGPTHHHLLLDH